MEVTGRGFATILHGLLFGGFFLMALYGLGFDLCRSAFMKAPPALTERGRRWERVYLIVITAFGWLAVLSGAYIVYPWYRAAAPPGTADLSPYPQRLLMSSAATSGWHTLGMEWKEHAAWLAAICMTAAAYLLTAYGTAMKDHPEIRTAVRGFILTALLSAGIAGFFGAMLSKYAPIQGGPAVHLMGNSR